MEYPNHYQMKQMRKIKILETEGICEICGNKGKHIHHKDFTKNNHNVNNLLFLCGKCHGGLHRKKPAVELSVYRKNYYLKNRDKILEYGKEYHRKHYIKRGYERMKKYGDLGVVEISKIIGTTAGAIGKYFNNNRRSMRRATKIKIKKHLELFTKIPRCRRR